MEVARGYRHVLERDLGNLGIRPPIAHDQVTRVWSSAAPMLVKENAEWEGGGVAVRRASEAFEAVPHRILYQCGGYGTKKYCYAMLQVTSEL